MTKGWIRESQDGSESTRGSARARIVYELTADGKERFQTMADKAGPASWGDEEFDVHFAFFARTPADVRLRILEGRRSRLEERLANIREASVRNRERMDSYTAVSYTHLDVYKRQLPLSACQIERPMPLGETPLLL